MPDYTRPTILESDGLHEIYSEAQLRRYYAVKVTGGVKDATYHASESVKDVARWILDGDEVKR